MKQHTKSTSVQGEQNQSQQIHEQGRQQTNLEFANVEEMFRHDAVHTPVPPAIEVRLQESIAKLPVPPPASWWKRILGQ